MILHAGAKTSDGLIMLNLWPSKADSDAASNDPRRLAALEQEALTPDVFHEEHHEDERYVVASR
ncbi:MAG: hypothetical protein K6T27_07320 [Thermoleophilum sp.]|nr:hypothetical protein [Thermoleophilum sp.]